MKEKTSPLGVRIISAYCILAAIGLIVELLFLKFTGPNLLTNSLSYILYPVFRTVSSITEFVLFPISLGGSPSIWIDWSLRFIFPSIFMLFVGGGLWKGKNWARITAMMSSVLLILIAIYTMFRIFSSSIIGGLIILATGGIILSYLLFNKKVKEFFKN